MNRDSHETLSTADLANATDARQRQEAEQMRQRQEAEHLKRDTREVRTDERAVRRDERAARQHEQTTDEKLAPLFQAKIADEFRSRWDQVQFSFVDDPKRAVREGDELVAQVMKCLAQSFSEERSRLEQQLHQNDATSTENLRMALRRYRSFFHRLLSL